MSPRLPHCPGLRLCPSRQPLPPATWLLADERPLSLAVRPVPQVESGVGEQVRILEDLTAKTPPIS